MGLWNKLLPYLGFSVKRSVYFFEDIESGALTEHSLSSKELEEFKEKNPHLKRANPTEIDRNKLETARKDKELETYKNRKASHLIIAAWVIEICAAGIGFFFAWTTGQATRKYLEQDTLAFIDVDISVTLSMLPFMIIGVVELTKIPLAFATYHAKPGFWKALFIGVLLSLCLVTGETIFTGMERSLDNQLKYFEVDKKNQEELIVDVLNLEKEVIELEGERPINDIEADWRNEVDGFDRSHNINLENVRKERQERITELENQRQQLIESYNRRSTQDEVGNLKSINDDIQSRINSVEESRDNEIANIRATAQQEIDSKEKQIIASTESIKGISEELTGGVFSNNSDKQEQLEAERATRLKAEEELGLIKSKRDEEIRNYRSQIETRVAKLEVEKSEIQSKLTQARTKSEAAHNIELERIDSERESLDQRFDTRRANLIEDYVEDKAAREINYLEARDRAVRLQTELDNTRAEIKKKKEDIIEVEQTINSKAGEIQVMRFASTYAAFVSNGEREGVENVTEEDIGFVMLLWFGSIALIAATTGTVIAFASFYIRDEKNWIKPWHETKSNSMTVIARSIKGMHDNLRDYLTKKLRGETPPGIFRSIGQSIVRLTDAIVKRLTNPKIVREDPIEKIILIPKDELHDPLGYVSKTEAVSGKDKDE